LLLLAALVALLVIEVHVLGHLSPCRGKPAID
jgi:hypothetical protein